MAEQKKHWLANALDWGMRGHWLWTVFPASWKAAIWAAALVGITALLALLGKTTAVHWWLYSLAVVAGYIVLWIAVQRLAKEGKEHHQKTSGLLDGEIYRIIIYPKMGDLSFKLLEGKYIADGRNVDDVRTDCDVLIEGYTVNRSHAKVFLRDFLLYLEIDGERKKFASAKDFVLEDLFGKSTEYGLQQDDDSGMKEPDSLPSLRKKMLVGFDPGEPLEGWVRFSVESINPRKQYPVAFSVFDSIGEEHPITRMSKSPRIGSIALRRVTSAN